jgi:hypothetical protein
MSVCPNINTPEWKALEAAVGRFEAYKDFVDSNYEIRTIEEVQNKINERRNATVNAVVQPHMSGLMSGNLIEIGLALSEASEPDFQSMAKKFANESSTTRAMEIARKLSDNLNVDFDIITAKRAQELTANSLNPWSGQAAFYYGGQVFFVGESLSLNSVLHEFSHPFIRQIQVDNPDLFNNIYTKLASSTEGQKIIEEINETHPDLIKNGPMYREEVIVKALEHAALNYENSSEFEKFLKDVMFAIKKVLRTLMGKIDVAKLDQNTTLDELAYMLQNEKFDINTELVTEEDVVAYLKSYKDEVEDMKRVDKTEIQALISQGYDLASSQLKTLQSDDNYRQLALILKDQYKVPDMENIMSDLRKYKNKIDNIVENEIDAMELLASQASALINTIYNVDTIMRKIQSHMDELYRTGETQDNLQKAAYYRKLTNHWGKYIEHVKEIFNAPGSGVDANSKIYNVINTITTNLEKINKVSNEMGANGARDALYQEFEPMGRDIKKRYTELIENLKAKGARQATIDKWHKEYYGVTETEQARFVELRNKARKNEPMSNSQKLEYTALRIASSQGLEITPEKIEDLLKGNIGDANWMSSYLEGYMYNSDPVIGGLALYVKNGLNEVMVNVQAKFNEFSEDIKPLLEAYGYNPHNIRDLGKKVLFEDIVASEVDGVVVKKKIWTFLNPFKNYRHDLRMMNIAVNDAEDIYNDSGSDEALLKLRDAVSDRKDFLRKYFHQEYNSTYYERQKLLERDDIGKVASHMRESIIEKIRKVSISADTQTEQLEIAKEVDALWRDYRQLHSTLDLNGVKKTGNDLAIAERLREYRENSRQFYEWAERPGVFQNLLETYEKELESKFARTSPEFETLRDAWIRKNTRVVIKSSWYNKRQKIFADINEILSTLPDQEAKELNLAPLHEAIIDLKSGFRDEDGQPNPSEMTEAAIKKIKDLEDEIQLRKEMYRSAGGLTPSDQTELDKLYAERKTRDLTETESLRLMQLYAAKSKGRLNPIQRAQLDALYAELESLSSTEATSYYVDIVNNFLQSMDTSVLEKQLGSKIITEETSNIFLEPEIIDNLKAQSEEFAKWYDANHHTIKTKKGNISKRVSIWSVVRPNDPSDYESTEIKDSKGRVIDIIEGLPSMKFYRQEVKEEFKTPKIIGKTIDNKGQWLPKSMQDGAADNRFINEDYERIKERDPKLFELLEKLKEHHLKNQIGLDNRSKLYLDSPRFTSGRYETLSSTKVDEKGKAVWNGLTQQVKRMKEFLKGAKDDAESGFNYKDELNLVKLDMFDDEVTNIPISGLYDIDSEDASLNITTNMMKYMASAERQKQLVRMSPLARAIQSVVNDPKNMKEIDKLNKWNLNNRNVITFKKKKGLSVRAKAVNNFIEREFEGQKQKGVASDSVWLNNVSKALFGRASFQFFALNIPSAMKNHFSAKFQTMIQAASGDNLNPLTAGKGEAWATIAMGEMSFGGSLYGKGANRSLNQQLIEIFDVSQGRFIEKIGDSMSRSITKDFVEGSWLYSTRKWLELQATMQLFGGMMYHKNDIEQKMPDGTTKNISYMDAWEMKDNRIQLKEGVDPKWGITYDAEGKLLLGREFSHFKNKIQQTTNNLNGAYAEFDQPEAQRYIAFRFVSYLRKYFTPMVVHRFGHKGKLWSAKPRLNPGMGEASMGYYIRTLQGISQAAKDLAHGKGPTLSKEETQALMKTMTEIGLLILVTVVILTMFGWDPDDEDRYDKLREKSGALDFWGTTENSDRPFNLSGFMELHTLNLLMQVKAENEQFLPTPGATPFIGGGLSSYMSLLDIKSLAFGPTMDTYSQILDDMIHILKDDGKAYYTRDTGPYDFQKEGGSKLTAKLAKLVGFTGSSLDGAMAIQKFYNAQAMARR